MSKKPFLLGAGLLVLWGGVDGTTTDEHSMNDWWTNEHLPERLAIPGFRRARRFYAASDQSPSVSKYLTLYEVTSLDTLTSAAYMSALNNPTPGTAKWMPTLAAMNRSACTILHSAPRVEFSECSTGVGATIAHIAFIPPADSAARQALKRYITDDLSPKVLASHPSILAFHLVERDEGATGSGSKTKSYEAVTFSRSEGKARGQWIVLVEFAAALAAPYSRCGELVKPVLGELEGNGGKEVVCELYQLICAANE